MLKKSTLLSLAIAGAWLSPVPQVAVAQDSEAAKHVLDQLNAERETTRILLEKLKSTDPSVIDVYFALDDAGQRTMVVSKVADNGLIETWMSLIRPSPKPRKKPNKTIPKPLLALIGRRPLLPC